MSAPWKASVTVAAIVERDGRFLLVEEQTPDGIRLNQPAGHLDPGETLVDAVIRETLEETARRFTPDALLGVYMTRSRSARTPNRSPMCASPSSAKPAMRSPAGRSTTASCARCG